MSTLKKSMEKNIQETNDVGKQDKKKDNKNKTFLQLIKFCLVGLSNTVISYVIYVVCFYLLHTSVYIANVIAFLLSVLNAYFWQERFVFKEEEGKQKRVWWKVLLKTYAAYMFTGLIMTELLTVLWLKVIDISKYADVIVKLVKFVGITWTNYEAAVAVVPFLNLIINTPINFVVNKFWAYKQKKE